MVVDLPKNIKVEPYCNVLGTNSAGLRPSLPLSTLRGRFTGTSDKFE